MQEVAAELEREKENLLRKVSQRDKQIDTLKEQASANQKQLAELQNRLAKVWAFSDQLKSMIFIEQRYIKLETVNIYLYILIKYCNLMINQARRKSRGDQKRDLALLESQSNAWREQISEKTTEIQEKDKRIQVCPI